MDKKMAKVTKKIQSAEKVLKKAEMKNKALTKEDKEVRDPKIEKYNKMMKKGKC